MPCDRASRLHNMSVLYRKRQHLNTVKGVERSPPRPFIEPREAGSTAVWWSAHTVRRESIFCLHRSSSCETLAPLHAECDHIINCSNAIPKSHFAINSLVQGTLVHTKFCALEKLAVSNHETYVLHLPTTASSPR